MSDTGRIRALLLRWLPLLSLFLLVLAGRAVFVSLYCESMPLADMWDAEAAFLLKPWMDDQLTIAGLLAAHNEHRIVFTRLISLVLFESNGEQWDNLVAAYLNAALYAGLLVAAYCALRGLLHPTWARAVLFVTTLIVGWLPIGVGNTLVGFQNQFYLMAGAALAVVWVAAAWLGDGRGLAVLLGLAVLGLGTMASGLLAAAAAGLVLTLRAWTGSLERKPAALAVGALAALTLVAFAMVPKIAGHAFLKADSVVSWAQAFGIAVGWPLSSGVRGAAFLWLPVALVAHDVGRRRTATRFELIGLGMAAWVILQSASIAYSRGNGLSTLPSRYLDILVLGLLANLAFALARLSSRLGSGAALSAASAPAFALLVFGTAAVVGLRDQSRQELSYAEDMDRAAKLQTQHLRAFVAQGDPALLDVPPRELPYPDKQRLQSLLGDKTLRAFLPATIREPLAIEGGEGTFEYDREGLYILHSCSRPGCVEGKASFVSAPLRSTRTAVMVPIITEGPKPGLGVGVIHEPRPSRPLPPVRNGMALFDVDTRPFRLAALDSSPESWLALGGPREVGPLSFAAHRLQTMVRRRLQKPSDTGRTKIELPSAEPSPGARNLGMKPLTGSFPAPRAGLVSALGLLVGTYAGTSDGRLVAELCSSVECKQSRVDLSQVRDNEHATLRFVPPLSLRRGETLRVRFSQENSTQPVAVWLRSAAEGSVVVEPASESGPARAVALSMTYLD
jgi:hypothetical protein